MFDGELDEEFLFRYVRNIKLALVTPASAACKMLHLSFDKQTSRHILCNAIDTMNTMLLRAGKPRIWVQSIAQQGKVDYDVFGKPKDEKDPDAMLVLFCEKLGDEAPVQLGKTIDLNENLEFQRAWRKAEQTRCQRLFDKQREQLQSTIQTGLQERAELDAENSKLKAEAADAKKLNDEIKRLKCNLQLSKVDCRRLDDVNKQHWETVLKKGEQVKELQEEVKKLKAANAKLKAEAENAKTEAEADVGRKRARGLDEDDFLSKMAAMMDEKTKATVDSKVAKLKEKNAKLEQKNAKLEEKNAKLEEKLDTAREENKQLQANLDAERQQLQKARSERDRAMRFARQLKNDNEKKVKTNEKLRKKAKGSAATMGYGTRAWALFLGLDASDTAAMASLQERLSRTVATVHRNRYLALQNEPGILPYNQTSLDEYMSELPPEQGEDTPEEEEEV